MHFFLPQTKVEDLFVLVVALKTQAANAVFYRQNKTNKAVRCGNIFIFCSHYYRSKTIRRARQGGARAWIFQPSHLTWRALV